MKTVTRLGTFEDVLAGKPEEIQAIAKSLRDVIITVHPDCVEVPRPGEPSAAYGVGEKKMREAYAYIMPQKSHVNLGFFHGVTLSDFEDQLEGSGKRLRHIKIHSVEEANRPVVQKILQAAIQERKRALNILD